MPLILFKGKFLRSKFIFMDKIKMWLIPVLIVILVLGGLVYFRGKISETEPTVVPETAEEVRTKPKGFAKAPEPTPQQKAKINAEAMAAALDSGNVSDCDKIVWSEEMRKQCEDNLNYGAILRTGDEDQCDKLSDEALKTQCYNKIYMSAAVDSKDPALCEKISDAALKQMCLDQVQMIVSRYAKSAQDCAVISSAPLRKQCEDNFYLQASAKSLNMEGCNNIANSQLLEQCKTTVTKNLQVMEQSKKAAENATVAKTLRDILALCDDLTGSKTTACKDAVYPQLAFDEKDLTYCDRISDADKADECRKNQGDKINAYYLRQSLASSDKTLCNQIMDAELKALCQNS